MAFDPNKPFEVVNQPVVSTGFDPSKPFDVVPAKTIEPSSYELFKQQYLAQQQRPTLQKSIESAMSPVIGVGNIIGDLLGIPKGIAQASSSPTPFATGGRSLVEGARRAGVDIINLIRQSISNTLTRGAPLAPDIGSFLSRTPSEQEIQKAFDEQQLQEGLMRPENQLIQGEVAPNLVEGTRQAIPLAIPLVGAGERLALQTLIKEGLKTGTTAATSPVTAYYGAKSAQPFLSGERMAGAQSTLQSALDSQNALQRGIQESLTKEQLAQQGAESNIAGLRQEAAVKGRESRLAGKELQTAEGTLTPQIVQAQTSFEAAKNLPPIILGRTAEEAPAFGRGVIDAIQKPLQESKAAYNEAYQTVTDSLPSKQGKAPATGLYNAAKQAGQELSEGFEAFNKGKIRSIINESTKIETIKPKVPQEIQNLYDNATPAVKEQLLAANPGIASEPITKIPQYSWNELQRRFQQINSGIEEALKYGNTNDARILKDLKDGIVSDMQDYAQSAGTDVFDKFKEANQLYKEHQDKFGLNRIQTLFRDDILESPSLAADKIISGGTPESVQAIKNIVSPEEFEPVKAQISQKLLAKNIGDPFDPSYFIKKFPEARPVIKAAFGDEGLAQFQQIYDASQGIAQIQDFQKVLDGLRADAEGATKAFQKAKGTATEAENVLAEKNRIKDILKPFNEEKTQKALGAANKDVRDAVKDLERVRNYSDLKEWATRISGLNILQTAFDSQAGRNVLTSVAASMDKINSKPKKK